MLFENVERIRRLFDGTESVADGPRPIRRSTRPSGGGVKTFIRAPRLRGTVQADPTDPEALLATLAEAGVVDDDGETVSLTPEFRERRRERLTAQAEADGPAIDDELRAACDAVATDPDDELYATAAAVAASTDLDAEGVAASALALGRLIEPPAEEGVPDGFTPIRGEEIEAFLERNPTSVLYFWGYDCDPCDVVKEDLEALQEDGTITDDVGLAAVCGADSYELVRERYEVAVAPTTIFCANGRPDSRLIGAHHRSTMASEIETVREL